jgi:hypothetical protein
MKIAALAVGLSLLTASATSFAWGDSFTTYKILGMHTQIKGGAPFFTAFFLTPTKAIVLQNLDKPDVQFLQKELELAFQTGKSLSYVYNPARAERIADWIDLNVSGNGRGMTFWDVYSGDEVYFRIK